MDRIKTKRRPIYVCAENVERARNMIHNAGLSISECRIVPKKEPHHSQALIGITATREQFLGDFSEAEIHIAGLTVRD